MWDSRMYGLHDGQVLCTDMPGMMAWAGLKLGIPDAFPMEKLKKGNLFKLWWWGGIMCEDGWKRASTHGVCLRCAAKSLWESAIIIPIICTFWPTSLWLVPSITNYSGELVDIHTVWKGTRIYDVAPGAKVDGVMHCWGVAETCMVSDVSHHFIL